MAPRTLTPADTAAIAPTELRLAARRLRAAADDVIAATAGTVDGIRHQAASLEALADDLDIAALAEVDAR